MSEMQIVEDQEPVDLRPGEFEDVEADPNHRLYDDEPEEQVAEPEPEPPAQPSFETPREHGLYRALRKAEERRQHEVGELMQGFETLQEQVSRLTKNLDDEEAARREAAETPDGKDPIETLTYRIRKEVGGKVLGELGELRNAITSLQEGRQQEAEAQRQTYLRELEGRAVAETRQHLEAAPEPVKESIRGWAQRNHTQMVREGADPAEAAAVIQQEIFNYSLEATKRGMTLPQLWAHAHGIDAAGNGGGPAAEPPPPAAAVPDDVRRHQLARRTAPQATPRGRGPSPDGSSPIEQLAARVGELDTETFYERVEEIAEALRLSPEAVEQRVETVIRRAARGGQKG
jgi:hypothetical protein